MTNPKENTDLKPISIEARSIVNQLGDLWEVPVDIRQATNDANWEWVDSIIEKLVHQASENAVEKYKITDRIERLDIQCLEGNCKNCDSKRPLLAELTRKLKELESKEEA